MKKYVVLFIVMGALMLESCIVTFEKPQPEHAKSLTSFPKRLQGKYFNYNSKITYFDSTEQHSINITNKLMIENGTLYYVYGFGFGLLLDGDSLMNSQNEKVKNNDLPDSIYYEKDKIDTLFNISSINVLKKFKGYYFLNYTDSFELNKWYVQKLGLRKDTLTLYYIPDDQSKILEAITGTTADKDSPRFNLTRRQFKRFIKQGGFTEEKKFIRKKGKLQK